MVYTLMHKEIPVAAVEIDSVTNGISKVLDVFDGGRLPLGVQFRGRNVDVRTLNRWWIGRSIPASRSGIRDALEALDVPSTETLLTKCFGLSLSDQYWVNPSENPLKWADINFFDNDFSEDVGNALFGQEPCAGDIDLMSPDNTSDGWLKKKWTIADKKRILLKGGSAPYYQEPLNEQLASSVLGRLGVPHVEYSVAWENEQPLSVCEDFIIPDSDLVSAWQIYHSQKKPNHLSAYAHFLNCCEQLGIPRVERWLDEMFVLDYLIANTDRHFNNFGAVRDVATLTWSGPAPFYDNGTSMWHDQIEAKIQPEASLPSKPFAKTHSEQIALVTSFDWIDFRSLVGLEDEFSEILKQSSYIDDQRRGTLCSALKKRVEMLVEYAFDHAHNLLDQQL